MSIRPDIAIYSPEGRLQLIAETKGMAHTDVAWASHYRRNLLAHRVIPSSPYFLLVASDKTYLWTDAAAENPAIQVSTISALARYLPKGNDGVSASSLELAVQWWLNELIAFPGLVVYGKDERHLLEDSGLLNAIRAGSMALEAVA